MLLVVDRCMKEVLTGPSMLPKLDCFPVDGEEKWRSFRVLPHHIIENPFVITSGTTDYWSLKDNSENNIPWKAFSKAQHHEKNANILTFKNAFK